jgi:hypothetical protein
VAVPVYESDSTATSPGSGDADVTLTKPSGTASGDLLIAHIVVTNGTDVAPPDGTWTPISEVTNGSTYDAAFWKVAGGSEPADYTFGNTSSGDRAAGAMCRISGADGTTPVNAAGSNSYTGDSAADESPSVTTTVGDCLLVLTHGADAAPTTNVVPSGSTEQWYQANSSNTSTKGATVAAGAAGATGAKVWDVSGFTDTFVLRTIAVAPAGGGGGAGGRLVGGKLVGAGNLAGGRLVA